jgi:FAD/FMN-containing dehydrogenase
MSNASLGSWGNYPKFPQEFTACHWRADLPELFARTRARTTTTLPYGAGRSYGDSCMADSDHVLHMRPLDRFIGADWHNGVIAAEAGVTLEEILHVAIPRGWFVPVTPGTKYVTLGGAIANDVHGKNHHRRGTFGLHVRQLGLLRSDSGRMACSPAANTALFNATVGGLGLTGLIEWAELQLVPIRSSQLVCVTQRFNGLDEFFALSDELDAKHEFCVSWVDCMARGKGTGRGVYSAADFAADGPLEAAAGRRITMPVTPPVSLVNRLSLPLMNQFIWRKESAARRITRAGYDPFFYPLDAVLQWNRIYGPRGFQQYQVVIPDREARDAIRAMLNAIASSATGSFLAVLKRCGGIESPGLLSFPTQGTSLALDFPQADLLSADLFPRLDAIVREAGGRLYPAKDAHMTGEDFRRNYPAWNQVEAVRDPALMSRFWRRVIQ